MKKLAMAVLLASAPVGSGMARAQTPAAKAPSTSAELKQLEHHWTDAAKAGDVDKLGQINADDWTGIGPTVQSLPSPYILRATSRERAERKAGSLGRWT